MPSARSWWRDIEIVFPLCLLVVTTIYLAATFQISTSFDSGFVTSAFTPRVVAAIMYVALLFVLRDAVRRRSSQDDGEEGPETGWAEPVWVVALTCAYIAAFRHLGYVLSTFLYVYLLFHVFRFEEKGLPKRILYAAAITAVFYILFAELFGVRLPKAGGIL